MNTSKYAAHVPRYKRIPSLMRISTSKSSRCSNVGGTNLASRNDTKFMSANSYNFTELIYIMYSGNMYT